MLDVNVYVMNDWAWKKWGKSCFPKAKFHANIYDAEVNNWINSSLDYRRESEWENKGIMIGFLIGFAELDVYYPRKLLSLNLEFYNSS